MKRYSTLFGSMLVLGLAAGLSAAPDEDKDKQKTRDTTGTSATGAAQSQAGRSAEQDKPKTGAATGTSQTASRSRVEDPNAMVNASERKFLTDAAQDNMAEIRLGQIAQKQAANEAVKEFGTRMEKDHGAVMEELKKLAATKNVDLPTDLSQKHQNTVDRLSKLNAAAFDKAYAKFMVQDHKKAVSMFERMEKNAVDSDVKAFASKHLPTLREHHQEARNLTSQKTSKAAPATGQ